MSTHVSNVAQRQRRRGSGTLRRPATLLAAIALNAAVGASSLAAITATTGGISQIPAPTSVVVGALESDVRVVAFGERRNVLVFAGIGVEISMPGDYNSTTPTLTPGVIPPGTSVDSYFLHGDAVGNGPTSISGTVTFDTPVLGIVISDGRLDATDGVYGNPGTSYPGGTVARGINVANNDKIALSADRRTVEISFPVFNVTDQVRIFTAHPTRPGMTFSMDFQGPSRGAASPWGPIVLEGSILTPAVGPPLGPYMPEFLPPTPPGPVINPGGGAAAFGLGLGLVRTDEGIVEVDALSYGRDSGNRVRFSVDEWARGSGGLANGVILETRPPFPAAEAAADVFTYLGTIGSVVPGNVQWSDGNGDTWPGVGLVEPNRPLAGVPDEGDNLDALDSNTERAHLIGPVFFSLDSAFPDPFEASAVTNSGSAAANGFVGGDVLVVRNTAAAAPSPAVFIRANRLGLDRVPGHEADSDDLDALALNIVSDNDFSPVFGNYTPDVDWILFSVRRNSAVIGQIDSRLGIRIDAGDILTFPMPGGLSPYPAIVVRAEALGLETFRSNPECGLAPNQDLIVGCADLDALDTYRSENNDTDGDGIFDDIDNCRLIPNPDQRDTNGDGYGNACDTDFNNDCISNVVDLGLLRTVFFTNAPDMDVNGDGVVNVVDLGWLRRFFFLPPGPGIGFCP